MFAARAAVRAPAACALPHTGTVVSGDDALRAVRLVDRLAAEVAARRARGEATAGPRILLLIDGVEPIGALLDEADPSRGSAHLLRLLRDGAAVGLTCVLTADRAVPGGPEAAAAPPRAGGRRGALRPRRPAAPRRSAGDRPARQRPVGGAGRLFPAPPGDGDACPATRAGTGGRARRQPGRRP